VGAVHSSVELQAKPYNHFLVSGRISPAQYSHVLIIDQTLAFFNGSAASHFLTLSPQNLGGDFLDTSEADQRDCTVVSKGLLHNSCSVYAEVSIILFHYIVLESIVVHIFFSLCLTFNNGK
jgi:hypothetical protein